jgi:hypothetical protein
MQIQAPDNLSINGFKIEKSIYSNGRRVRKTDREDNRIMGNRRRCIKMKCCIIRSPRTDGHSTIYRNVAQRGLQQNKITVVDEFVHVAGVEPVGRQLIDAFYPV